MAGRVFCTAATLAALLAGCGSAAPAPSSTAAGSATPPPPAAGTPAGGSHTSTPQQEAPGMESPRESAFVPLPYTDVARDPSVHLFSGRTALETFHTGHLSEFSPDPGAGDDAFGRAIAAYNDAFFAQNALAVVFLTEPSGSIRHEVTGIAAENGVLTVHIRRLLPDGAGTDDMARTAVFVAVDAAYAECEAEAVFDE